MRKLIGILLFVVSAGAVSAQRVHFIYLQTEASQPFYLKMNSEIYSSSVSGYLILPELVDSTYNFSIGFPSSALESRFTVPVGGKDRGFLVKTIDGKIALFDMQSLTLIRANLDQNETISYQRRNDDFASLLSKAAKDTSLLYSLVKKEVQPPVQNISTEVVTKTDGGAPGGDVKPSDDTLLQKTQSAAGWETNALLDPEKKSADTAAVLKNDAQENIIGSYEKVSLNQDTLMGTASETQSAEQQVFTRSRITKHAESSTSEGFGLVFYDDFGEGIDTIQLIIPNSKLVFREPKRDTATTAVQFLDWDEKPADTATKQQEDAVMEPEVRSSKETKVSDDDIQKERSAGEVIATPAYKTDCKTVATSRDFFKLRKNMAAQETDEGMVGEARKYFKTKCFSTEQIKNLSALFLTSAGKYQFFDAAYFHVTDPRAFRGLASEIKDDYYLRRFQALIGE